MILSKTQFKKVLLFIYTKENQQDSLCNLLEKVTDHEYLIPALIYTSSINMILSILETMFEDTSNDIFHLVFELEVFKYKNKKVPKKFCPMDKIGKKILYYDISSLYDYLVRKLKKEEN